MSTSQSFEKPAWLDQNYILDIVRNKEPDFIAIEKLKVRPAVAADEHNSSVVLRITVQLLLKDNSVKTHNYILKTMLDTTTAAQQLMKTLGQFPKEKRIYEVLLPQFEQLLMTAGGLQVKFGAEPLRIEETPTRITFILEDLQQRGFRNVSRLEGLDMEHMRHALRKIAEFHAASALWRERNGDFGEQFNVGQVSERSRKFFEERTELLLDAFKNALQQWGLEPDERYEHKVPTAQQFVDELIHFSEVDWTRFNVLNHGDLWCNNIMFNYKPETNQIENTYFVDYQLCKYGPPSYDIYVLILTSASLDIKMERFIEFLEIYQQHLMMCLRTLNYSGKIPTLDDIKDMLSRDRFYAFFMVSGYLPVTLMPLDNDSSSLQERMKGGEAAQKARLRNMLNPIYVQHMLQLWPWLCQGGFMDF